MVLQRLGPGLQLFQCGICQERFSVICDFFKHFEVHRELLSNSNIAQSAACPLKGNCCHTKNKRILKHTNSDTATAADILADLHNLVHIIHNSETKTSDISLKEDGELSLAATQGSGIKCAACKEKFPTLCAIREHLKNKSFYFFESIRTCIPQTLSCSLSAIKSEVFMSVVLRKADERQDWVQNSSGKNKFSSDLKEKDGSKMQKCAPIIPSNCKTNVQNKLDTNSDATICDFSANSQLRSGLVESDTALSDTTCINSQTKAETALIDHGYSTIISKERIFDHGYSAIHSNEIIPEEKRNRTSNELTADTVLRLDDLSMKGDSPHTEESAEESSAQYQEDCHSDGENSVDNSVALTDIKEEVFDRNTVTIVSETKPKRSRKPRKPASQASLFLQRQKKKKKIVCDNCGMTVSQAWLQYHVKICTSGKQFPCNICGAFFAIQGALFQHRRSVHLKEYSQQCESCGYLSNSAQSLAKHMLQHTGEKKYICSICSKAFIHQRSLKLHEKMHAGIRDFLCSICGMAFYSTWNLKRHMLTH